MNLRLSPRLSNAVARALGVKDTSARRRSRAIGSDAAQQAQMCLANAASALRRLTDDEREQWRVYAATQTGVNPKTGVTRPRQYDKVFMGLAFRFFHCTPGGSFPKTPPPFFFGGDPITVTATAGPGTVVFTATGATSPNVRVELLLQTLATESRAPQPGRYRTQAFASFAGEPVSVPYRGGPCVPAYRFVNAETGQDTPMIALPKLWVEPAAKQVK